MEKKIKYIFHRYRWIRCGDRANNLHKGLLEIMCLQDVYFLVLSILPISFSKAPAFL